MSWRYIVSKEYAGDGKTDVIYGVREYYETVTGVTGWSEPIVAPQGETYDELILDLHHMLDDANDGLILDLTLDPPGLVKS
jgi:hypothetical protein